MDWLRWSAKEAHAVSPHFAQLMYFGLHSALFMVPVHFTLSQTAVLFQSLRKSRVLSIVLWLMGFTTAFLSVHFFSIAHPYLLADNRHYTFYIWRKIINVHWSTKYLMVPLYVYSWFSIFSTLAKISEESMGAGIFLGMCRCSNLKLFHRIYNMYLQVQLHHFFIMIVVLLRRREGYILKSIRWYQKMEFQKRADDSRIQES